VPLDQRVGELPLGVNDREPILLEHVGAGQPVAQLLTLEVQPFDPLQGGLDTVLRERREAALPASRNSHGKDTYRQRHAFPIALAWEPRAA